MVKESDPGVRLPVYVCVYLARVACVCHDALAAACVLHLNVSYFACMLLVQYLYVYARICCLSVVRTWVVCMLARHGEVKLPLVYERERVRSPAEARDGLYASA